eukprot:CAMPEP_0171058896 /NCGR_PEP_ID=MMETSP0766_2-20121228/2819_1 /TAXON_ID=439317 /ORGANISM="Gambierdiscus australes, Strain CAWD 149" /LENGTH=161 /DNA_ID=CAMNT_0011514249 /DNA_START=86 /DNA_END=570 /DNA_ORIENTATION=+
MGADCWSNGAELELVLAALQLLEVGNDTPIGPDKVVGLLVFSASTGLTLVLALVLAACGAPQPRRGGSKAIHFFKLAAITGILAGMQFWIMGRLIWWFLDARSPTRNLADDSPVLLASLPGELEAAMRDAFAGLAGQWEVRHTTWIRHSDNLSWLSRQVKA